MLTYEDSTHTYRWNGDVRLSVTQIEEAEGLSDLSGVPFDRLEASKKLGDAVHLATHYEDEGTLDPRSVDPVVAPYLAQWIAFKRDYDVKIVAMETAMYHERYQYPGRIDRLVTMRWNRRLANAILDIKTGVKTKAHGVQLAAYRELVLVNRQEFKRPVRIAVYLTPKKYDPVEYAHPSDFNVFLAALNLNRWKAENL